MEANIQKLFEIYLSGQISKAELQQLLDRFDTRDMDEDLMYHIRRVLESESGRIDQDIELIGREVKKRLDAGLKPPIKSRPIWQYLAAAAAILLAISIATIYFFNLGNTSIQPTINITQQQIKPGSDKAILVLSDGRSVSLTDSSSAAIIDIGGKTIAQVKDGTINYLLADQAANAKENAFNTVLVPQGGQYKITLPDGSKAWLNAGSSLRYSVNFGSASRILELTGEGYFEVVKNKKLPFTVKSGSLEVTALGTQFNVNTYSNEPYGAATLVEGSLKVSDIRSQKTVLLTPGEQAYQSTGGLKMRLVNTFELTAWKDGLFVINKASLEAVMRQIERWYDVEVDVKLPAGAGTFTGELPKNISIAELLQSLETVTGIKLKLEGRRITNR
ncbi:FecR family protein [Sphingobacterium detergens]|uniref:FecR family protein n=1 Tax=Sphingobacterium detergens TaxID=1145106 RepID=A0A420ARR2_SPHD1|nr:FecR domain-containing protein [Sphingobacterium detergens]RKE47158.1 FecR family protein [Sphingobacterium detergens]